MNHLKMNWVTVTVCLLPQSSLYEVLPGSSGYSAWREGTGSRSAPGSKAEQTGVSVLSPPMEEGCQSNRDDQSKLLPLQRHSVVVFGSCLNPTGSHSWCRFTTVIILDGLKKTNRILPHDAPIKIQIRPKLHMAAIWRSSEEQSLSLKWWNYCTLTKQQVRVEVNLLCGS